MCINMSVSGGLSPGLRPFLIKGGNQRDDGMGEKMEGSVLTVAGPLSCPMLALSP